jgi:hypothetical protein
MTKMNSRDTSVHIPFIKSPGVYGLILLPIVLAGLGRRSKY